MSDTTSAKTSDDEQVILEKPKKEKKPRKPMSAEHKANLLANLAKARAVSTMKKEVRLKEQEPIVEALIVKRAAVIKKKNDKETAELKKLMKVKDEDEDEIEEHVTIKPKKKKIIYREESDSEEEVVVRRAPRKEKAVAVATPSGKAVPVAQVNNGFRLNFV